MIGTARWLAAVAVSAQIGCDDREIVRKKRGHAMPHDVRLWVAVKKKKRRSAPAAYAHDGRAGGRDRQRLEPRKHVISPRVGRRHAASANGWSGAVGGSSQRREPAKRGVGLGHEG